MDPWSIIDKSLHPEEFAGIVYHDESTSNFSVRISAILETKDLQKIPTLNSAIRIPFVCLYFDNTVVVFTNEKCDDVGYFKTFDSKVCTLIIQSTCDKVVILLCDGTLHTINLNTKKYSCTSSPIVKDKFSSATMYEREKDILLTSNVFQNSHLGIGLNSDEDDGIELQLNMTFIAKKDIEEDVAFKIALAQQDVLKIHESLLCMQISQINGNNIICPITGHQMSASLMENVSAVKSFQNSTKLLYLKDSSPGGCSLCVGDFNSPVVEFSIAVSKNCFIIGGVDLSAVYVDITGDKMYIYHVQQNSPLSQLEILIASRNYERAELFAQMNNLSPIAVLELKAKFLLSSLKKQFSTEYMEELKDVLLKCNNTGFLVNCCISGAECEVKLSDLLSFAKRNMEKFDDVALKEKIDDLLWKVDVFNLLQNEDDFQFTDWTKFLVESPLDLCLKFLSDNQLDRASIVWYKCHPYIIHKLTLDEIADILTAIAPETKLNSLLRWLEHFIPSIMDVLPQSADVIVNWAQNRICLLENSGKHWPEIGIKLAEKFSALIFNIKTIVNFVPHAAENFNFLVYSLKNIQCLKGVYNVVVSLRDFMTLKPIEILKLVLRKTFTEDLKGLLSDFIDKFVIRHSINHDVMMKEYIEELINLSPVIDEDKMEILLDHIHSTEEKLQCVLLVLKSAKIPWSDNVRKICDKSIALQHVLTSKIRMEKIHADVRTILMKYECNELISEDYEYLIRHIILKGDSNMMMDIEKITSVYTSLREDAYVLCIQKYLELSDVHSALKVFDLMDSKLKTVTANTLLLKLETLLDDNHINSDLESHYLDFLKSVNLLDVTILKYLKNICILKNRFDLKISLSDYCIDDYRRYFFIRWCKDKIDKLSCDSDIQEILFQTCHVGHYLLTTKSESILILFNELDDGKKVSVGNLILSEKYFISDKIKESVQIIVKVLSMLNVTDLNILESCLKHVLDLVLNCNPKHMAYFIDVCSWLYAIYLSHNSIREILSTWKISCFYNPHVISSILPTWQKIFSKYDFASETFPVCLCEVDHCNSGYRCLPALLTKLQVQQNDIYFSRVLAYYTTNNIVSEIDSISWFTELNDNMINVLISKAVMFERADHLLISMLLLCHSSPAKWLNDSLSACVDIQRKVNISKYILLSKEIFHYMNVPYKHAFEIYSHNSIACKLENYGIFFKDNQQDTTNVNHLLNLLVNVESFNSIVTLEEFCLVTNISLDQALMYYLFSILKSWQTNYEIVPDNFGNSNIIIDSTKCESQKCLSIVNKISSKDDLVQNLQTLFEHGEIYFQNLTIINLSQYCYEVYIFILDLLKNITGQQMFWKEYLLLKFLQTYKRVSKPKQTELDMYCNRESFPKIGFYRLPFQSLIRPDFLNNLKTDITLSTYQRWLSVAGLLPRNVVTCDMIRGTAVKQSMTSENIVDESADGKWYLHSKNGHILNLAYECICHITNLEWAGACFYYVVQGSLPGADQVAAADMCYQFAEHWSKIQPNNNVVKKMQSKHLMTSTVHILHKIGLAEGKLLSLCESPHRLIEALYNHDALLTPNTCPDINEAVDEIAEKHGLNTATIRMNILEKILNLTNVQPSQTASRGKNQEDGSLNRDTLLKACYILKGTNQMMAALYLSRIALDESESLETYSSKIRALQCLLSLFDNDVIEKVTNMSVTNLWAKLWDLYFTINLRSIGLEFLSATFLENKNQAFNQIWFASDHTALKISFLIKMVIIYNLRLEDSMLDEILKMMLKLDMSSEMKEFLKFIKSSYSKYYIEAWNSILLTPFKRLDSAMIGSQKDECFDTLKILPSCPVLSCLDMSSISHHCITLGALEMAVLVLPHVNVDERKNIIKKLGKMTSSKIQDIKLLKSKGIVTTNIAVGILKQEYLRCK